MSRVLSSPGPADSSEQSAARSSRAAIVLRAFLFLLAAAGLGAVAGVVWWAVVDLPVYVVGPDGGASTSQQGLTQYVAGDAWYSLIGFVGGLGLGLAAWRLFRRIGWPVVPLVIVSTVVAALICWLVGWQLGPGPFAPRLAEAAAGQSVPIELTVRARAAVLVWPFAGVLVILLGSSLGRDDEEPRPLLPRRGRRVQPPG